MPYIPRKERYEFMVLTCQMRETPPKTVGQLTYLFYVLALTFIGKPSFMKFAMVIGALVCTVLELYRRRVSKYENEKIKTNGDVNVEL